MSASNSMGGLHAALDLSVINPLQAQTISRAAVEPGHALNLRHQQKLNKHGDRCLAEGIKFCPVVCETMGGWHPEASTLLKRLGVSLARAIVGDEGEVVHNFFGRLSILLMRSNASLLLHQVPTFTWAEEDGNL